MTEPVRKYCEECANDGLYDDDDKEGKCFWCLRMWMMQSEELTIRQYSKLKVYWTPKN